MTTSRLHLRPAPPDRAESASSPSACCSWSRHSPPPPSRASNRRLDATPPAVPGETQGERPADGPVRGSRRPRRRPDPVHGRRARDRAIRATCLGPLDGGRRVAAQPARRAPVRSRDPRRRRPPTLRSEGLGEQRDEPSERPGRHALGRPAVCGQREPGRRRRSGWPSSRGLRLPAVLGAHRPFDPARLADALDHRLLRDRGRRQRRSPAQERRRIDDRRAGAAGRARS